MNKPLVFLAACGLALSAAASDITPYIDNLNSDDYALRQSARLDLRQALVSASPRELKSLERELLRAIGPDHDWATRDWSIRMLELVGTSAAVRPLTRLLDDPDPRVRDLARKALSAIPDRRAAAALEKAVQREPIPARAAYADALAYRHDDGAVRELTTELERGSSAAALALGKIGGSAARSALARAYAAGTDNRDFQRALELALLDAGLDDAGLARTLAEAGQNEAIQAAAFSALVKLDAEAAAAVLQAPANPDDPTPTRAVFLRAAMGSSLSDRVVAELGSLPESEQIVVLEAIADLGLSDYEDAVLALLAAPSETLHPVVVRTLGRVGTDASFQPLLDLYLANERDRDVTAALARLNAASTDATLLETVRGDGPINERVAALRLLVLRATAGVTELVNRYSRSGNPPELREAAFTGMEVVGDTESVRQLLALVLANDPQKRSAQSSLKKLSANLAVPDYLWNEIYAPALAAAPSDDARRDVFVIVDGNSGPAAAAHLQELILGGGPLKPDALNALRRWTDISGVDAWIDIATAEGATAEDQAMAKQSIVRIIGSTRTTGLYPEKVQAAAAALRAFADDTEFRLKLIGTYQRELHWQTRAQISRIFPEFLADESIAAAVQELLDRAAFR